MRQDKFLTGILVGVVVLVVIAVGLFFFRDSDRTYIADGTPQAVVLNYVLAVQTGDYQRAYSYLAEEYEDETKPSFAQFRSYFSYGDYRYNTIGINIISVDQEEYLAWVNLETVESDGGLFREVYRARDTAILIKDDSGDWKLISMPYQFWGWEWYGDAKVIR